MNLMIKTILDKEKKGESLFQKYFDSLLAHLSVMDASGKC